MLRRLLEALRFSATGEVHEVVYRILKEMR
jgi:hypothetical protein